MLLQPTLSGVEAAGERIYVVCPRSHRRGEPRAGLAGLPRGLHLTLYGGSWRLLYGGFSSGPAVDGGELGSACHSEHLNCSLVGGR